MNSYSRSYLRDRFLAEQQLQLAKDAKLTDPADAYRALVEELSADPDSGFDQATERAA